VVLLELLKARGRLPKFDGALDVFCVLEDETLRADSLKLIQDLRDAGCAVDYSFTPAKPDKQFKRALEMKAAHTIRLERNPAGELDAKIKNLTTREETAVALDDAVKVLAAKRR
jgi:histidyl-tRNA synthetase